MPPPFQTGGPAEALEVRQPTPHDARHAGHLRRLSGAMSLLQVALGESRGRPKRSRSSGNLCKLFLPLQPISRSMSENLGTYLNDHLAGSVAAVGLIDDLVAGENDASLKTLLTRLKREIGEEQDVLRKILQACAPGEGEGVAKKG